MATPYLFTFQRFSFVIPLRALGASLEDVAMDLPHPTPLILGLGSAAAYVCLIALWPRGQRARGGSHGFAHHVALCLYSLVAFSAALYHLASTGELLSLTAYACAPLPAWLRLISLTFTLSKIWEWGDTLVMLERGDSLSKIGFLHLYHHATTFLLFLNINNFAGTEKSGMLMNGFVHTLMYGHYAFRLPRVFRPFITAAQVVQLASSTWLWHVTPQLCPAYASFHKEHPVEFLVPYLLVPVYLAFFLQFFYEQYVRVGKGKARKEQ